MILFISTLKEKANLARTLALVICLICLSQILVGGCGEGGGGTPTPKASVAATDADEAGGTGTYTVTLSRAPSNLSRHSR